MGPGTILKLALRALGRNRVRSVLTMLGVIIGVAAVIAMVSLGAGAQAQVANEISSMGANILYVWPGSMKNMGMRMGAGSVQTLNAEDADAIQKECPAVRWVSPMVGSNVLVVYGNQNWSTRADGANEQFPDIRNWQVESGAFFTDTDVRTAARVAVLGHTVADHLFQGIDPEGQTIRVRNLPFRVLGVLSRKGQNQWGRDQDDTILVPYTTVQKKLSSSSLWVSQIMVSAVSSRAGYTAEQEIAELLRQRHRIAPGREDDFNVRNLSEMAEAAEATQKTMGLLLGSIAGVSLIVGGIGIMNIMLVSVAERTREIGIRMAVGARSRHVRLQFLSEALVLSTLGGLIGITLGILVSFSMAGGLGWPTLISKSSILVSVVFSAAVGVFFGYYPASKAAALDPIDALRYE
ncbi:MAG: ABC transporter permease [Acidobacteria bacterium]|nr:ABC transporter permease [Acidobacteriota bacterium]